MGMRPAEVSTSDASGGAKASAPIPVNWRMAPFELGIQCDVTGTVDYDVQYTLDDIREAGWSASTALWTTMTNFDGKTADFADKFAVPCTAVRLLQNSGNGSIVMRVVSAGK